MAEPDWADEYDPTNPDGPPPENRTGGDTSDYLNKLPSLPYNPIRTNLGPVGFQPAPPQEDPTPYSIPQDMHPNMEIRQNEGPFLTEHTRGQLPEAHRDLSDYLITLLPAMGKDTPYRTLELADRTRHSPAMDLAEDPMMGDAYFGKSSQLARDAGMGDIDKYVNTFHMPDPQRENKLNSDLEKSQDTKALITLPEYMRPDAAEKMAKEALDEKGSNPEWQGKDAPTQADIDLVLENPTDGMIQKFEDKFGKDAIEKYFPEGPNKSDEGPVPLPKSRPKSAPKHGFMADPLTSGRERTDPADDWDRMMNDWEQGIQAETPENRGKAVDRTPEDSTAMGKYNKRKASKRN